MKTVFVIAMVAIIFSTSCGNQSKQPTTNTPTAPDSAVSNGTEGTIGSDTGVGTTGKGSSNNKYDTSKNDSMRKDSNKKY